MKIMSIASMPNGCNIPRQCLSVNYDWHAWCFTVFEIQMITLVPGQILKNTLSLRYSWSHRRFLYTCEPIFVLVTSEISRNQFHTRCPTMNVRCIYQGVTRKYKFFAFCFLGEPKKKGKTGRSKSWDPESNGPVNGAAKSKGFSHPRKDRESFRNALVNIIM